MEHAQDVVPVAELDLTRYAGLWYEIGRLPMKHQDRASSDVTAEYRPNPDGTITVDNRCFDQDGTAVQALGRAEPVPDEPGQLKVSFLPKLLRWIPFTEGDYWVLRIEPDYSAALVGTPDRQNLWLLSRTPQLDEPTAATFLEHARAQGFDLAAWIDTEQTGRKVTDQMLADA